MSVYLDDARSVHGRMVMCHMLADSRVELDEMADLIGVARRWIQAAGTYKEHYDICKAKRGQALKLGAIRIDSRRMAEILRQRRS